MAVEEFELIAESDVPTRTTEEAEARRNRPRRSGRPAPWVIAAAALILIGSATAQHLTIPGTGTEFGLSQLNLRVQPDVAWEVPLAVESVLTHTDDVAVVQTSDAQQQRVLTALDLATGVTLWTYTDRWNTCQWGDVLICIDAPATAAATAVKIDLRTGGQERSPAPEASFAVGYGGGMVLVVLREPHVEEGLALVAADGEELWRSEIDVMDTSSDYQHTYFELDGRQALLNTASSTIDLSTGELSSTVSWELSQGVTVTQTTDGYIVTTPDGDFHFDDRAVVSPTDDLGGPIAFRTGEAGDGYGASNLITVDRETGAELWRTPCYPLALVRGVVALQCWNDSPSTIDGVDAATGEPRWSANSPTFFYGPANRDALLLAGERGALYALEISTGDTLWELAPPTSQGVSGTYQSSVEVPRGLLLLTSGSVQLLTFG